MTSSALDQEEQNIDYTLSLAAVKSGYLEAMAPAIISVSIDSDSDGYEVEQRQEAEKEDHQRDDEEEREGNEESEEHENEKSMEMDQQSSVESSRYETDKYDTEIRSNRSGWETVSVSSKLKGAKKKFSRFVKKVKQKKSTDIRVDADSMNPPPQQFLTSYSVGASSGATPVDEAKVIAKGEETVTKNDDAVEKETNAIAQLEEVSSFLPERKLPEFVRRASAPASFAADEVTPDKAETNNHEPTTMHEPAASKEENEVLQKKTSETDEDDPSMSSLEEDEKLAGPPRFEMSQVSTRTFIINQTTSIVDPASSNEEKTDSGNGFGFFSCGCGDDREEWDDDDFEDDSVVTDSEEGRVADAVITIQEHARRLGLTEYELLEMINDD